MSKELGTLAMNARIFFSFIVFIAFFIAPCKLNAQGYKVNIKLAFWADTTIWNGFNPIIQTYKNYLESYPDSDYNNPYWNESEKQHYKKFDFSKTALFQKGGWCTAKYVFKEYNVVILNIEQKDSVSFLIQSMLWGDSLGKKYERFNPLAMHRYYVIKEANNWKMANALFYDTKNWIVKESEFIRYHFPFASYYSDSLANLNEQFCKALMRRFKLNKPNLIEIFAVDGKHEIGKLLGFDYYFMGYAEGRSIENIIMSGNKSIYYPHELVHQFFPKHSKRYWLVDEGFATWLGGSMGKTYMERAAGYAKEYCKIDTASFDWAYKCEVLDCYPLGAILIDVVHEKAGDEGVLDLLKMDTETLPELYDAITNVTDWDKEQFNKKFEEKIIELSKVNMVN